jgi:uncharacterized membrane protein
MDSEEFTPILQQRNPITYQAHRRQAFWQIYFPLIVFTMLVMATIVLVLVANNAQVSNLADISLIFIISITMVAFLVVTVGLIISIVYSRRLLKATPYFFFNAQRFIYLVEIRVKRVSNAAVEPILRVNGFFAGAGALRRKKD